MTNSYRVAVVGCGAISGNHIMAIKHAGQTLCALCDIDPAQAQKKIEQYELTDIPVYTDFQTMLREEKPDAVHICTPHYLHAPMAITALEQNIHVLCEKPLCISLEQLNDLRTAVKSSRAQLGVCHQNRYEANMLRLKELAEKKVAGAFGSVVWHRDANYYNSAAWRGTWDQEGGGVMINQALHTLDLMQWVCGFPTHVTAHISNDLLQGVIEVEDTASACFECANGTRFNFFATNTATASLPVQIQIKLKTGDMIDAQNDQFCFNHELISTKNQNQTVGKRVWGDGHKDLICDFYRHVSQNRPFPIGFDEGEKVIRLILSMYQSNGKRIAVVNR